MLAVKKRLLLNMSGCLSVDTATRYSAIYSHLQCSHEISLQLACPMPIADVLILKKDH